MIKLSKYSKRRDLDGYRSTDKEVIKIDTDRKEFRDSILF